MLRYINSGTRDDIYTLNITQNILTYNILLNMGNSTLFSSQKILRVFRLFRESTSNGTLQFGPVFGPTKSAKSARIAEH